MLRRWLAATQCQPTDARKIMPLLDEPELKAQFQAAIIHEKSYGALSNMPEVAQEPTYRTGYIRKVFQSTHINTC